jgi:hypothetical protein
MNNAQRTHAHRRWAINYSAARSRVHHMAQQAAVAECMRERALEQAQEAQQAMREAREQG